MSAPSSSGALAPDPSRSRTGRPRLIVLATVLGWNALAMASLWTWTAIAMSSSTGGEDWSGLGILIIASTTTLAILVSMAIGVTVALVRARRHGWPTPAPTGKAIFAGTRTAAWGLCAIVANLLLILYWIW
jgi:hypothetical protein